jgi:hypothetical protein
MRSARLQNGFAAFVAREGCDQHTPLTGGILPPDFFTTRRRNPFLFLQLFRVLDTLLLQASGKLQVIRGYCKKGEDAMRRSIQKIIRNLDDRKGFVAWKEYQL